jgi:hypothetical protein
LAAALPPRAAVPCFGGSGSARRDTVTGPKRSVADGARSPRVRSWGAVLPMLAIAAWAAVGVLAWLVIRLLQCG